MQAKIAAAMAKLTPEDRKVAEAQKICAVTGMPLGTMGAPVRVDIEGRPYFICCEGCSDHLREHSVELLEKLSERQAMLK